MSTNLTRNELKAFFNLPASDRTPTTKLQARYDAAIATASPVIITVVDSRTYDAKSVLPASQPMIDSRTVATVEPPSVATVDAPALNTSAAIVGIWVCLALLLTFETLRDLFVRYALPHIVTASVRGLDNSVRFLCRTGLADYRLASRFGVALN